MANKYSRYELQPFPSLYVDDNSIDISKLLAQRYDANKQSKDLIDRTLSQMELLDGDKAHGERVKGDVKGILKDHIAKGDWENSSLVVADAAASVENDQGLIWANKSMQNRQAEINAIREAKLNGIPMIDFGSEARKTHQSYYYDEAEGTYIQNVYEPMSEAMLDYRSRKEAMIGKIPADQQGALTYVGRGKTNKIANLLVEQYIADTKEGMQEYKKLVEVDLPQSIPVEERMKMAKNAIKKDFQEAAQQQEFNRVAATSGGDDRSSGAGGLPEGVTIKSSLSSKVNTHFDEMDDKIYGLMKEQKVLLSQINMEETSDKDRKLYQTNFDNNAKMLKANMKKVAKENGDKGKYALEKYENIESRFDDHGPDGQRLMAAVQYLTYNTKDHDTDWNGLGMKMTIGGSTLAGAAAIAGQAGPQIATPEELITVPTGFLIGGGIAAGTHLWEQWNKDLRNVRDWHRPQEGGYITGSLGLTDNEREQLAEELWGDEDLNDASVDHVNKILGTNFNESDKEELMKMTNAYYTFMTKDKFRNSDGQKVDRMSGDDLFDKVSQKSFVINQPTVGFDMTAKGKALRSSTSDYIRKDMDFNTAGIASDNMLPGSDNLTDWIEDGGGAGKLQLEFVRMADIATNTPMKLTFGFEGDAEGKTSRDFYVTDPTVMQPKGWVYDLLDKNMGLGKNAYDEALRQQYSDIGYENVPVGNYIADMSYKNFQYGGGGSEEDLANATSVMQDKVIMDILLNPNVDLPQYPMTDNGRVIQGANAVVPFNNPDGGFNAAAWTILQSQPNKLAKLRANVLNMSLQEFSGYNF